MIFKKIELFIATAALAAVCCVNCGSSDDGGTTPQGAAPKLTNCSISTDDVVAADLENIDLRYSTPIVVVDESKITLKKDDGESVEIAPVAKNLSLDIVLGEELDYESHYTLNIKSGAIASKSDTRAVAAAYTMQFTTEEEPFVPDPDATFEIDQTLITPNATAEAKALYDYLREGFGKRTLSGAMCKYTVQTTEAEWMKEQSGKYPALICYDFMNATRSYSWDEPYSTMITSAKEWHDNGGVVSAMWHWRDPSRKTEAFYSMTASADERTSFDVSKVNDTSSSEYKAMVEDIDVVAEYLLELQELNIPVLWRPLHEAQGAWFWWGAGSADDCKALWDLLYERLVEHHKLHNLIWVWTVNKMDGANKWYPGNDNVDIVGTDIYGTPTHKSQRDYFDFVATIADHEKLVALSECGAVPHPDNMISGGDVWSWFMPWVGEYTHDDKFNGSTFLDEILNTDLVITRDEVNL